MRWLKRLGLLTPRTGRMIKEDGGAFNEADYLAHLQEYDPTFETVNNGAFIASYYEEVNGFDSIQVGLSVPAGKQIILFNRDFSLNNGTFLLEVSPGTFTGGTPLLLNALRSSANPINLASTFNVNVTPDGPLTPSEQTVFTAGGNRNTGGIANEGVFKVFDEGASGILSVTRVRGSGTVDLSLQWVAWERDVT